MYHSSDFIITIVFSLLFLTNCKHQSEDSDILKEKFSLEKVGSTCESDRFWERVTSKKVSSSGFGGKAKGTKKKRGFLFDKEGITYYNKSGGQVHFSWHIFQFWARFPIDFSIMLSSIDDITYVSSLKIFEEYSSLSPEAFQRNRRNRKGVDPEMLAVRLQEERSNPNWNKTFLGKERLECLLTYLVNSPYTKTDIISSDQVKDDKFIRFADKTIANLEEFQESGKLPEKVYFSDEQLKKKIAK